MTTWSQWRRIGVMVAAVGMLVAKGLLAQGQQPMPRPVDFGKGAYEATTPRIAPPVLTRTVAAKYTADAMRMKIQGRVEVEVVIGADGRVVEARVTKSLDPTLGLDRTAVEAAKQYVFNAAMLDGKPVAVFATLDIDFRLH